MATTEMEADLRKTKMEQDAAVEIAKINAAAAVKKARLELKQARWRGWNWTDFTVAAVIVLIVGGLLFGAFYQHVNYTNKEAERVASCGANGGTWTPIYTEVKDSNGKTWTDQEWVCKKG